MTRPRVGIVGVSDIAIEHAKGAIAAGFSIAFAVARSESSRLENFRAKFNAAVGLAGDFEELLSELNPEVLVLAIPASEVPSYINTLRQRDWTGILLIEKPGALNSCALKSYSEELGDIQIYFAYNRRFYSSFAFFQQSLPKEHPIFFDVLIGESGGPTNSLLEKASSICTNSVHILDLLLMIDRQIINTAVRTTRTRDDNFLLCDFSTDRNTFRLSFAFGQPVLSSVQAYSEGQLHRLQPIEKYQRFEGIGLIEPTAELPIRSYFLKEFEAPTFSLEGDLKPGFGLMWKEIADRQSSQEPQAQASSLCSLEEAVEVLSLAEKIAISGLGHGHEDQ